MSLRKIFVLPRKFEHPSRRSELGADPNGITSVSDFMKMRSVVLQLLYQYRRTDKTILIGAFRETNAHRNVLVLHALVSKYVTMPAGLLCQELR